MNTEQEQAEKEYVRWWGGARQSRVETLKKIRALWDSHRSLTASFSQQQKELEEATAELATLREKIEKMESYMEHASDCAYFVGLHSSDCNCGLSALTHPLEGK